MEITDRLVEELTTSAQGERAAACHCQECSHMLQQTETPGRTSSRTVAQTGARRRNREGEWPAQGLLSERQKGLPTFRAKSTWVERVVGRAIDIGWQWRAPVSLHQLVHCERAREPDPPQSTTHDFNDFPDHIVTEANGATHFELAPRMYHGQPRVIRCGPSQQDFSLTSVLP